MENNQILSILKELSQRIQTIESSKIVQPGNCSAQIDKLAAALSKAQAQYPVLGKNRQGHFTYADKNSLKRAVDKILLEHELCVTAGIRVQDGHELFFMKLLHSSGQYQISECILEVEAGGKRSKAQERGAAISYLSRYLYRELLGITIDDDPDDDDGVTNDPLTTEQITQLSSLPIATQQSILSFNKVNKLQDLTQKQYAAFKERFYKKKD